MNRIIVIAGTDSSGGAGLTRDAVVAAEMGCQLLPVVTAVTAQTDRAVTGLQLVTPDMVAAQIAAALSQSKVKAVKIGMLGTPEIALAAAMALETSTLPVVLDPVLVSSSGKALMSGMLPSPLIRRADLLTPNLPEAAAMTRRNQAANFAEIAAQADLLRRGGARAVLIKGGHGAGDLATDHLFDPSGHQCFSAPRLNIGRRGTGCSLATAIACELSRGHELAHACAAAKAYVHAWLRG